MTKKKEKAATNTKPKVEPLALQRVRENVKHNFTDDELITFGYTLGQKYRAIRTVQTEKKAVAADYAAREKSLEADIDEVSGKFNSGFEMRIKDCFKFMDYTEGRVYLFLCEDVGDPAAFKVPDSEALLEHLLLDEAFTPVLDRKLLDYERQAQMFPEDSPDADLDQEGDAGAEVDAENQTVETS